MVFIGRCVLASVVELHLGGTTTNGATLSNLLIIMVRYLQNIFIITVVNLMINAVVLITLK